MGMITICTFLLQFKCTTGFKSNFPCFTKALLEEFVCKFLR